MSEAVIHAARSWIGTPYRHGASRRGVGCDCLGLVRGVWREVVGPEPETPPRYAPDWAELRTDEPLLGAAGRAPTPADIGATVRLSRAVWLGAAALAVAARLLRSRP